MKIISVFAGLAIMITMLSGFNPCGSKETDDEWAYFDNSQIEGAVTILNHPELGKTPGSGVQIVFQRDDCEKCIIAVDTNLKGRYGFGVKQGRFKVIIRDGTRYGETRDVLAPNQPRYVDVGLPSAITKFDIEILLPETD